MDVIHAGFFPAEKAASLPQASQDSITVDVSTGLRNSTSEKKDDLLSVDRHTRTCLATMRSPLEELRVNRRYLCLACSRVQTTVGEGFLQSAWDSQKRPPLLWIAW